MQSVYRLLLDNGGHVTPVVFWGRLQALDQASQLQRLQVHSL